MMSHSIRNYDRIDDGPAPLLDNPSTADGSTLLTVTEAAAFLTISKSAIRRLQQARRLPFIKVGGSLRFARSDLVSYLAKRRVEAVDQ